ncbi:MAG: hypothetical protein P8J87_17415, partial [Verrucomicrobiales bacterium]|nr:hypothetical protein [Verrucomicrobiales bacterium]
MPLSHATLLALAVTLQPLQASPGFFAKHCTTCHDAESTKAGLNLETLQPDFSEPATADIWQKVLEQLETQQMPPKEKKRPDPAAHQQITTWIRARFAKHNILPSIDHKRLTPDFGNHLDHDSLFDGSQTGPASSPPRLWRLNPYVYDRFVDRLSGLRHAATIHQPFALDESKGTIADYSTQHLADSATLQLLMMNCQSVAEFQTTGILKREWDGTTNRYREKPAPFKEIIDSKSAPSRGQLAAAISHEYQLFLGRPPTASELDQSLTFAQKAIASAGNARGL